MNRRTLLLASFFGLELMSGLAFATPVTTYEEVTAGLQKGAILLIDIREPDEFSAGHVPGAVNMPLSSLAPSAVPKPADKTVVIMCRSGSRSGRLAAALTAIGRSDVVDYSGAIIDWTRRGGPLAQGK